ncbi:4Fe-4S binding protein, partial [uncultured Duncaniella sp.]
MSVNIWQNTNLTDGKKCMMCCRCINVCPSDARHLGGLLYKV